MVKSFSQQGKQGKSVSAHLSFMLNPASKIVIKQH